MSFFYEYRCIACGARFTRRRAVDRRNEPATCPQCDGPGRRVISTPQKVVDAWSRPQDPEALRNTPEIWE